MENQNCIFCKIANNEVPSKTVFEDSKIKAFWDLYPKDKVHILIIPKKHINKISDIQKNDINLMGELIYRGKLIAKKFSLKGYKLLFNVGKEGGQEVFHIHLHLIGH